MNLKFSVLSLLVLWFCFEVFQLLIYFIGTFEFDLNNSLIGFNIPLCDALTFICSDDNLIL